MACKTSYELHHHFPKLAEESGFTFNTHRPRVHIDWNKIRLVDIESLIRERKFFLVEQHLNDILDCVLESEFDVRILDEGVIKMFRLAQLAVEYQQFCRHYLDRSVYVLREEINALVHELEVTKKDLREKDEEIKKLRKKTKYNYRTSLPYGNDNIATMILKTLSNKGDIFPSISNGDALQYNKCSYCDKVFLNQLYLKSHLSRRHSDIIEMPQKDDSVQNIQTEKENSKLNDEIMELKMKLKEIENIITKVNSQGNKCDAFVVANEKTTNENASAKKTKDAEVSTNNDDYLLDKIEEWKREEHEKYNKEINMLRTQIMDSINYFKGKEVQKPVENKTNVVDQLHTTIKQQGAEIVALKQDLENSRLRSQYEENERKKEAEHQMSIWSKRAEEQSKQYDLLIQKLNEVAKEAQESRAMAEVERERAVQLQILLQQSLCNNIANDPAGNKANPTSSNHFTTPLRFEDTNPKVAETDKPRNISKKKLQKSNPVVDHKTLKQLHQKAQELLSTRSTSSSDISSATIEKPETIEVPMVSKNIQDYRISNNHKNFNHIKPTIKNKWDSNKRVKNTKKLTNELDKDAPASAKVNEKIVIKDKSLAKTVAKQNGPIVTPGSPMKVVRAKICEEVNNRLVSVGVDPLKSRLPQNIFRKQRMLLEQKYEEKSKRNREYQKVKHSILSYLDSNTSGVKKVASNDVPDYISPSKITKTFSLTSVISNVKSKALSLVKSNDTSDKAKRKALNAEIAKKAMSLLKTPPSSATSSPNGQLKSTEFKSKIDSPARESQGNATSVKAKNNPDPNPTEHGKHTKKAKQITITTNHVDSDNESMESNYKYYNSAIVQQSSKSIENLIKSPARRPSSASAVYNGRAIRKYTIDNSDNLMRTQSAVNVSEYKPDVNNRKNTDPSLENIENSSENSDSLKDVSIKKSNSDENIQSIPKQTKGVLKNASSMSSLSKKKVLFDMDAIQMKSVSASPSQSITEKSDGNEKYELGLVNLDGEDWDISSIENEPLKNETRIQFNTRTSPKIAELKQTIESQLARRNETPSSVLVGGVDVLSSGGGGGGGGGGAMLRAASIGGSNTSLGSSILDDSDIPVVNNKAFVKPKRVTEKEDSELDISEYSIDGLTNRKDNESF